MDPTQQNSPNNGNGNGDNGSSNGDCACPEYPPCPPPVEQENCEPTFVPINLEICPVVKIMVNKPKLCLQNKAECKPCFFLDNCQNN